LIYEQGAISAAKECKRKERRRTGTGIK